MNVKAEIATIDAGLTNAGITLTNFCALAREKGLAAPDLILFGFVDLPPLQQDVALCELGGAA